MVLCFLDCELDSECCELRRAGRPVALRAKVFRLLAYLIEQRHRRVSKDELLEQIWPGRVIAEATLNSCVRTLRQAVGDDGQRQQVIQTVRGLGYRFVAEVQTRTGPVVNTGSAEKPVTDAGAPARVAELKAEASPVKAERPTLGKEHKIVSVLCGGVVDAGPLSRRLDAETMDLVMEAVFARVGRVIERYGGTLSQHHGDGFMALFGAPRAYEDDTRRAVLAAVELLQTPATDANRSNVSPRLALGLHTGPVIVGALAHAPRQMYTARSLTTDTARRLQQRAAPGTLLVSADSRHRVAAEVHAEVHGSIDLDGGQTISAFRVYGIRQRVAGVPQRQRQVRSAFVGRRRELAILQARLEQTLAGRGQLVGVSGEPGIGKSRLVDELRRRLPPSVTYLEGRCLPYGQNTPYLPLLDVLRSGYGVACAAMPDAAVVSRLADTLRQAGITDKNATTLLLRQLHAPLEPEPLADAELDQRRQKTFLYLRRLIEHQTRQQAAVLTLEDVHWIDATSDEWLTQLVARLPNLRLLVLLTYRPGYRPVWLTNSAVTQLALPPLLANDSERLLRSLPPAAEVTDDQIHAVADKAQGNPFFLEELCWAATRSTDQDDVFALPDTVQAVIAARIDRLNSDAKRLLQTAAVVGNEVSVTLLQHLVGLPEEVLESQLDQLQAHEFLYERQTAPETIYTFKHALTQEVAYRTLLGSDRRRLHHQIAELLTQVPSTETPARPEQIAHHYTQAGLAEQAVSCWQQAGEQALARLAYREAVDHLNQGVRLTEAISTERLRQECELELQVKLARALVIWLGYRADATQQALKRVRTLVDAVGVTPHRFSLLYGDWAQQLSRGGLRASLTIANTMLAYAQELSDPDMQSIGHRLTGISCLCQGRLAEAEQHLQTAMNGHQPAATSDLSYRLGLKPDIAAQVAMAWLQWLRGFPDRAKQLGRQARQAAAELSLVDMSVHCDSWIGAVALLARDDHELAQVSRSILQSANADRPGTWPILAALYRAFANEIRGASDPLITINDAVATYYAHHARGVLWLTPLVAVEHTRVLLSRGLIGEAEQVLGRVAERIEKTDERWIAPEVRRMQGKIRLAKQDQTSAESAYRSAIDQARELGAKSWELRAAASLARLWRQQEKPQQACDLLAPIYRRFTEGFASADLVNATALLDEPHEALTPQRKPRRNGIYPFTDAEQT